MRETGLIRIPLLAAFLLMLAPANACQVPVFRYALERWPADSYRLVALYSDAEASAEAQKVLDHYSELREPQAGDPEP